MNSVPFVDRFQYNSAHILQMIHMADVENVTGTVLYSYISTALHMQCLSH
jgi:hypothetical protein